MLLNAFMELFDFCTFAEIVVATVIILCLTFPWFVIASILSMVKVRAPRMSLKSVTVCNESFMYDDRLPCISRMEMSSGEYAKLRLIRMKRKERMPETKEEALSDSDVIAARRRMKDHHKIKDRRAIIALKSYSKKVIGVVFSLTKIIGLIYRRLGGKNDGIQS